MSRLRHKKLKALIINRIEIGETDLILRILTVNEGVLRLKARGARKILSKNAPHFDTLNLTHFEVVKGRSEIDVIISASTDRHYSNIKKDLDRLNFALVLMEYFINIVGQGSGALEFEAIESVFDRLDEVESFDQNYLYLVYIWFGIRLLDLSGRKPELYRCVICQKTLESGRKLSLSPDVGGAICSSCQKSDTISFIADEYMVKLMRLLADLDVSNIVRIKNTKNLRHTFRMLVSYLDYYLERPMHSAKILVALDTERLS